MFFIGTLNCLFVCFTLTTGIPTPRLTSPHATSPGNSGSSGGSSGSNGLSQPFGQSPYSLSGNLGGPSGSSGLSAPNGQSHIGFSPTGGSGKSPGSGPSGTTSRLYETFTAQVSGEDGCVKEFETPADLDKFATDHNLKFKKPDPLTITISVSVNRKVDKIGFVPDGCSWENTKSKVKGCELQGQVAGVKAADHHENAAIIGVHKHKYQACVQGANKAGTSKDPIVITAHWWTSNKFDPEEGFHLDPGTSIIGSS